MIVLVQSKTPPFNTYRLDTIVGLHPRNLLEQRSHLTSTQNTDPGLMLYNSGLKTVSKNKTNFVLQSFGEVNKLQLNKNKVLNMHQRDTRKAHN
ncbi:hypothetical protein QL285_069603 [Trifolium repens]|nr:hypothetical protein QL285_069603 [Trifolium repens]